MFVNYIVWNIDPVLFKIGSFSIRWYSILMITGFYLGYITIKKIFILDNVPVKTLETFGIFIVIGMFVGGRLGHCLFYEADYYLKYPLDIIKPWRGELGNGARFIGYKGMASHGGVIGVLIGLSINARIRKLSILWVFDRFAIAVVLAGAFIRLGNLFNSEILGIPSSLPWSVIFIRVSNVPKHPVQFYEAVIYFLIFYASLSFYLKNKETLKNGKLLGLILLLVFSSRFLLEFIKENQTATDATSLLKMGQILSIPFILIGGVLFFYKNNLSLHNAGIK